MASAARRFGSPSRHVGLRLRAFLRGLLLEGPTEGARKRESLLRLHYLVLGVVGILVREFEGPILCGEAQELPEAQRAVGHVADREALNAVLLLVMFGWQRR